MTKNEAIGRGQFIQMFMNRCGFTYAEATRAYECMCYAFEEGIVGGKRVNIGRVGAVVPEWKPGRDIHMHFTVEKGRKVRTGLKRTYHKDGHYTFKFKLYDQFVATRNLEWFLEFPGME